MKKIPLTQGKFALVDDADYEYLSKWKWCYSHGYAYRKSGKKESQTTHYMHRFLLPAIEVVDHINGNGLDNRRANLRSCTQAENIQNRKIGKNNTSGFKGVTYDRNRKKWKAEITAFGVRIALGRFDDIFEANDAYNHAAKQMHREFARIG